MSRSWSQDIPGVIAALQPCLFRSLLQRIRPPAGEPFDGVSAAVAPTARRCTTAGPVEEAVQAPHWLVRSQPVFR